MSRSGRRFGLVLLIADVLMYRVVSGMFDRERLLTGARSVAVRSSRASG
jgi:hypothetical protein